MKNFWIINALVGSVLILIFGFVNYPAYSNVPWYIFFFAFYDSIAIPIFVGSFLGLYTGWSYAMYFTAHRKEIEEDSNFYE